MKVLKKLFKCLSDFLFYWWWLIVIIALYVGLLFTICFTEMTSRSSLIQASEMAIDDHETSKLFILLNRDGSISQDDFELIKKKYEERLKK